MGPDNRPTFIAEGDQGEGWVHPLDSHDFEEDEQKESLAKRNPRERSKRKKLKGMGFK